MTSTQCAQSFLSQIFRQWNAGGRGRGRGRGRGTPNLSGRTGSPVSTGAPNLSRGREGSVHFDADDTLLSPLRAKLDDGNMCVNPKFYV